MLFIDDGEANIRLYLDKELFVFILIKNNPAGDATRPVYSLYHHLNQAEITHALRPSARDRKAHAPQQCSPLALRALLRRKERHHVKVQRRVLLRRVPVGDHALVDQNLRVPRRHGRLQLPQDDAALLVRPVMQDVAHVVRSRPAHRLQREEVVHRGLDEGRVLLHLGNLHHGRLLLQHEATRPRRDLGLEFGKGVPAAAADVDKCAGAVAAAAEAGSLQ